MHLSVNTLYVINVKVIPGWTSGARSLEVTHFRGNICQDLSGDTESDADLQVKGDSDVEDDTELNDNVEDDPESNDDPDVEGDKQVKGDREVIGDSGVDPETVSLPGILEQDKNKLSFGHKCSTKTVSNAPLSLMHQGWGNAYMPISDTPSLS